LRVVLMAKNFLVTGRPGVGKTTCLKRLAEILVSRGVTVGGMITLEVREAGVRKGFEVVDLLSGRRGVLASTGAGEGPRVGRYVVNLRDLEDVGVSAVRNAVDKASVVIIDEIGPMELLSESFKEAVTSALNSEKPVAASIHERARENPFGRSVLERRDVELIPLSLANRERVPAELARKIANLLARQ